MKETFGSLLLAAQNYISSDSTTSKTSLSAFDTFLKKEINNGISLIYSKLRLHKTQKVGTDTTVADQQFYRLPPDFDSVQSITHEVASVKYPLESISSQEQWDIINAKTVASSTFPQYYFTRRDDYGIWPIPTTASETITLTYNYMLKDLAATDATDGTVTVANDATTVTGSGTTFVAGMVGRWFQATDDGDWYRISAFSTTTSITLEDSFVGAAVSGSAFTIGESPEIPNELHSLLPHFAAAKFFMGPRRAPDMAQNHTNYFWTGDYKNTSRRVSNASGGLLAAIGRYASRGRSNSALIRKRHVFRSKFDERLQGTVTF